MSGDWFNVSSPMWVFTVRLWNLYNRRAVEGHWWGFGLVQLGRRHALYFGSAGVCLMLLWIWRNENER